jgi:hypothetical protein
MSLRTPLVLLWALETVRKAPEMPETRPYEAPQGHRWPVLATEHRPNPCSELCPDPFSDSF